MQLTGLFGSNALFFGSWAARNREIYRVILNTSPTVVTGDLKHLSSLVNGPKYGMFLPGSNVSSF